MGCGIGYLIYLKYFSDRHVEDLPSWFDMSHVIVIVVNRAAVIAVKYAMYSDEHYNLKRTVIFDREFLLSDLIAVTLA